MKRIVLILILIFSLSLVHANELFLISGTVSDVNTGEPVPDHDVYVFFIYGHAPLTLATDSTGIYSDSVWVNTNSLYAIRIGTYDCNGVINDTLIKQPFSPIEANFSICTNNIPPDDCDNSIDYIQNDKQVFTFTGTAYYGGMIIPAEHYHWDFGDGTSGEGQTVTHVYDTSSHSTFSVCLETIQLDSISNDSCIAVSCIEITVLPPIQCNNNFFYSIDSSSTYTFFGEAYIFSGKPVDPSFVEFTWNFGDGVTAQGEEVQHQFPPDTNTYAVCLTTFISDSIVPFGCEAISCQDIIIQAPECNANFIYNLDTLNQNPNQYYFFDKSEGSFNQWFWDFGDGITSTNQNPAHRFDNSGEYEICLTISNTDSLMQCTDDTCITIVTPEYFDMGGFVFTGDFPLNNPQNTGDTARAILYKEHLNSYYPIDSLFFHEFGYYWFSQKMTGNYLIKINLTAESDHANNWLPAYNGGQLRWADAIPFYLNQDLYNINIHLPPMAEMESGPGEISGNVYYSIDSLLEHFTGSNNVEVLLYDEFQQPFYTYSNDQANYSFTELPLGTYYLLAEETGMFGSPVEITLTENDPAEENVNLAIYDNNIIGIDENDTDPFLRIGAVYPNPVYDFLYVDLLSKSTDLVHLSLLNIMGQDVYKQEVKTSSGLNRLSIPVDNLPGGIYILRIVTRSDYHAVTTKFLK